MEDHAGQHLDAAPEIITKFLGSLPLRERLNCALVCKPWAEAATAATRIIILKHRVQDLSSLQIWLEKHGNRLEVFQLRAGCKAPLDALPCCPKLQDLLLRGFGGDSVSIASRTWSDIASASKLTSVSLSCVETASPQEDVVSALTALPNLEQLTWCSVDCNDELWLCDSSLLQHMTRLTSLELLFVTAAALQHLGSLTKLQHLSISTAQGRAASACPGLQELKPLTSLKLANSNQVDLPASASQLTALRQLDVCGATPTGLNRLHVLTNLTQLRVQDMTGLSAESPPLQLPGLQHLELEEGDQHVIMPMSFLARCTQLQSLKLWGYHLKGPGSLVQHLELRSCSITAANGAASWQQVFSGPGRLPHLTYLRLWAKNPPLQQADMDRVAEFCSNLQVLHLDTLQDSCAPALARLPGLTNLHLHRASDGQCSAIAQLTGLRQLEVKLPWALMLSAVGLRQLAALQQLTSLGFGRFYFSVLNSCAQHLMKDTMPGHTFAITNRVCTNAEFRSPMPYCGSAGHNGGGGAGKHARWRATVGLGGKGPGPGWGGGGAL